MHYHCEIVLPPSALADVPAAVEQVLAPFSENDESSRHAFWDWYQIGGRYAGRHAMERYDPDSLEQFREELTKRKVTVSGLQWGKQELSPSDQVPMVDELWQQMFPDSGLAHCPIFQHSNPGNKGTIAGDICLVSDLGLWTMAHRLIISARNYDDTAFEAEHMLETQVWNGVSHLDTTWNGLVLPAIASWPKEGHYAEEYEKKVRITPEHIAVTVDYHS